MTVRIYLEAVRLVEGPPQPGDIPAERLFVHASDVPELWVETESNHVPNPGRSASFFLAPPIDVGVQRIVGTIERIVSKETRKRIRTQ